MTSRKRSAQFRSVFLVFLALPFLLVLASESGRAELKKVVLPSGSSYILNTVTGEISDSIIVIHKSAAVVISGNTDGVAAGTLGGADVKAVEAWNESVRNEVAAEGGGDPVGAVEKFFERVGNYLRGKSVSNPRNGNDPVLLGGKTADGKEPDEAQDKDLDRRAKNVRDQTRELGVTLQSFKKPGEGNVKTPGACPPPAKTGQSSKELDPSLDTIRCQAGTKGIAPNGGITVQATEWGLLRTKDGGWAVEKSAYSTKKNKKTVNIHQCECALPARLAKKDTQMLELTRPDGSGGIAKVQCRVTDVGPWHTGDPYWENEKSGCRPRAEKMKKGSKGDSDRENNQEVSAGIDITPACWESLGVPQIAHIKRKGKPDKAVNQLMKRSGAVTWRFI